MPDPLPKKRPVSAGFRLGSESWVQPESTSEPRFTAAGEKANYAMMPLNQIRDQRYSVYWQMQATKRQS